MIPDLDHLWRAQELDDALRVLRERLAALPGRRAAIDARVARAKAALAAAEARQKEAVKGQRDAALQAESLAEQERRFQLQLTQVKKNEEYQALLHEIEGARRKRSDLETVVLTRMEEESTLAGEVAAAKQAVAAAEEAATGERAAVAADEAALRAEEAALAGRRTALLDELPVGLRSRYERLLVAKHGRAVVELVREACTGCGAELPPQRAIEVRRGLTVLDCPGCGRLLLHRVDEPPAEGPTA